MTGPAWLGIGAQRSGTSWLTYHVRRHPKLWVTPVKELHYFTFRDRAMQVAGTLQLGRMLFGRHRHEQRWRQHAAEAWKRHWPKMQRDRLRWDAYYLLGRRGDDWYCHLFDLGPSKRLPGEITPAYAMLDDDGVDVVSRVAPDARIIYLMRNPIDRAWSHLAHHNSIRPTRVDDIDEFLASEGVAARNSYASTLDRWENKFGAERIFAGFLDDIALYPRKTLALVYQHLGVGSKVPHPVKRRRIYSKADDTIPTTIAIEVAKRYVSEIDAIADRVGGHALTWQAMAHRLIDDPPATSELAHPLDPEQFGISASPTLSSGSLDLLP